MKTFLLVAYMLALPLGRHAQHHTLSKEEAIHFAAEFADQRLKDMRVAYGYSTEGWRADFQHGRWHMGHGSYLPTGYTVVVSFKADGSDPKLEALVLSPE